MQDVQSKWLALNPQRAIIRWDITLTYYVTTQTVKLVLVAGDLYQCLSMKQ